MLDAGRGTNYLTTYLTSGLLALAGSCDQFWRETIVWSEIESPPAGAIEGFRHRLKQHTQWASR